MPEIIPVQTASFRGVYETIGGVFTPKALEWTVFDDTIGEVIEIEFLNQRGLTFLLIKHDCIANWTLQLIPTKTVPDTPFYLDFEAFNVSIPATVGQKQNVIGPFSGSFDTNGYIQGLLIGEFSSPFETVSIAAIRLPQGSR